MVCYAKSKIAGGARSHNKNFGNKPFSGLEEIWQSVDFRNALPSDSLSSFGNPVLSSETGALKDYGLRQRQSR